MATGDDKYKGAPIPKDPLGRYTRLVNEAAHLRTINKWASFKFYPVADWQRAVLEGHTRLGYWDWVFEETRKAYHATKEG